MGYLSLYYPPAFTSSLFNPIRIMSKRIYNIIFHTHTISGIIISAALYVIFFTGSIAFLRDEINAWERNQPIEEEYFNKIDFDGALNSLKEESNLYGRDLTFSHRYFERRVGASMTASKDTTIVDEKESGQRGNFFYMDMNSFETKDYNSNYSLGEFFYRLHFFAQLNFFGTSGYILAGLVAFFFLFAVITGVVVHWRKIVSSFYVFRPGAKWKAIWTDAHVALGMIGLPYQFMFALTGCYLIIGYSVMLPPVQNFLYNGNQQELQKEMKLEDVATYEFTGNKLEKIPSVNKLIEKAETDWTDFTISQLNIYNYGDENMHLKLTGSPGYDKNFLSDAYRTYRVSDGTLIASKNLEENSSYAKGAINLIKRLHFGDFGGYGMKLIYLTLGFITCFVILSGVYIWLVARDKKSVSKSKRTFNAWLVTIYTAICLSLYPVTAITFSALKLFGDSYGDARKAFMYQIFFWCWLLFSLIFIIKRNNYFTNKACLWLGAVFGFLVPVSNGIMTGNWPWVSWQNGYDQILVVDLFWILLSITALSVALKLKAKTSKRLRGKPRSI